MLLEKFLGTIVNCAMLKDIGSIISYIFHPMIVSTFTFWFIIYQTEIIIQNADFIFFLSFFFSTVLPIITVVFLKKRGLIKDLNASNRMERLLPMALGALFFLIGFIILRKINSPIIIQGVMFCGLINTIIVWLITKYWKISIHTLSMSSGITIFWILGYKYFILMLLLIVLTTFSRLITNSHTLSQTAAGTVIGIISTYTQLVLLFI